MNTETAGIAAKAIATAGAAVAVFGLTWWALVAALIGAAASYHFEPEQVPSKASRLVFGIVAMGFAAALAAVALPHFPGLGWTEKIQIEVRAGLLGLSIRFLLEFGKQLIAGWKLKRSGG
jgi:hypothetical protein